MKSCFLPTSRSAKLPLWFAAFLLFTLPLIPGLSQAHARVFEEYDNRKVIYGYVEQGVAYVPADQIWRQLDMDWSADPLRQQLTLQTDRGPLTLGFHSGEASIDGAAVQLPHSTIKIQDTVYVSAETIAEYAGMDINRRDNNHLEISSGTKELLVQLKPMTSAYLYEPEKIDVILYHHFTNQSDSLSVTPETFREHLNALLQHGYETITDEDLYRYKTDPDFKLPKKPLFITIDDGYESNYTIAYPLLREKGLRATIYVITSYRGRTPGTIPHFSWEQAKEMQDSGVINIESHTHNLHYYVRHGKDDQPALLSRQPEESQERYEARIYDDLKKSRELIEQHVGKASISLSYPYGAYDEATLKLAEKAGYKLLMTTETSRNERNADPLIHRVNVDGRYSGEQLIRLLNP